jgi:micrococcal nuclease
MKLVRYHYLIITTTINTMGNCLTVYPESKYLPQEIDPKKIDNFIPPVNSGRVIKVYDGDTITIASKLPGLKKSPIYKFSVRLNGIDTPEMRGKNDDEKEMAHKARDALSARIFGKDVFLKNVQTEKYGRLLCDVYLEAENLNLWMIEKRYAMPYDGGTKVNPVSWREYHENNRI